MDWLKWIKRWPDDKWHCKLCEAQLFSVYHIVFVAHENTVDHMTTHHPEELMLERLS